MKTSNNHFINFKELKDDINDFLYSYIKVQSFSNSAGENDVVIAAVLDRSIHALQKEMRGLDGNAGAHDGDQIAPLGGKRAGNLARTVMAFFDGRTDGFLRFCGHVLILAVKKAGDRCFGNTDHFRDRLNCQTFFFHLKNPLRNRLTAHKTMN